MNSPDPVPPPPGPLAAIVTTDGTTRSATEVTGQALGVTEAADECGLTVEPDDCVAPTMRPPATPPRTRAAPSAAHSSHPRGRGGRFASVTSAPHSGPLEPSAATRKGPSPDAIVAQSVNRRSQQHRMAISLPGSQASPLPASWPACLG